MNQITRPPHVTQDHVDRAAAHLTDRDRRIALDCYEHGTLTTDQITRLHFRGERASRRRLERLYRLRVLDRFRPTRRRGEGSAPFHWVLDEVGARIVAAELGRDRDKLLWRRSDPLKVARTATLAHRLDVNEFFVRLAVEARAAGGALREWYGERTTQRLLDGIAAPDGYGVLVLPDRDPLHLLLELDRGTEPLSRIRDKVDRYAKAIPRSELADADPLVLFLAPSERRAAGVRDEIGNRVQARVDVWSPAADAVLPLLAGSRGLAAIYPSPPSSGTRL